jgi:hypothetical protein
VRAWVHAPLRLSGVGLGALVLGGADPLVCLGFEQLLHDHRTDAGQVDTLAGARTPRAARTRQTGTRPFPCSECLAVRTEDLADGPHMLGAAPLPLPFPALHGTLTNVLAQSLAGLG